MKVLQINAVYNLSSTGRTTTELHEALIANRIDSYVAYADTDKPNDEKLYHIGSSTDKKIHAFMSRISGKQAYFSHNSTKKLLEYIDSVKPDVIHLRNFHGNYINMPMLLKYIVKNDIATVVTLHDFWFLTGKCVYFTAANCDKWQTHCENCPNLQNGNPTWIFDKTKQMFSDKLNLFSQINKLAFVGVSQWAADMAEKSPMSKNATVKRIYNWIDFEKFYKKDVSTLRKSLLLENKFVVLGVSAVWNERKGLNSFIELSKRVDKDTKIVLIGLIPNGVSFPDNILCVGTTNSTKELSDYYNLADVLVTFSLEETFGKVSAEALSCGTPVICYNSSANPELVGDGCGYVVQKNNLEEVITSIEKAKKNTKEYYSKHCIDYAHENFNKDERIKDYIELYKELTK